MRRSVLVVLLAAMATAVLVAVVVESPSPRRQTSPTSQPVTTPSTRVIPAAVVGGRPVAAGHPGPTTTVSGVPMGYAHSPAGAEAAAVEFVLLAGPLVAMGEDAALDAQRTMATTAAAEGLVASLKAQLTALRQGFTGQVTYRVAPVATRVNPVGTDEVDVAVWYVGVVTAAGISPYEDWRTVRYRLVWERGDWRVAAEADTRGPRPAALPQLEPTPTAELEAALSGFAGPRSSR